MCVCMQIGVRAVLRKSMSIAGSCLLYRAVGLCCGEGQGAMGSALAQITLVNEPG